MLKEYLYLKQCVLLTYKTKDSYIYIKNFVNDFLLIFYIDFPENSVVVFNRKHDIVVVSKKLHSYFYLKIIPEFFLPMYSHLFIFRLLFLKHLFFLSTLFLLRHKTFRLAMQKLVLRYFYIKKLQHYFANNYEMNFLILTTFCDESYVNNKNILLFNIIDLLFFDFCLL